MIICQVFYKCWSINDHVNFLINVGLLMTICQLFYNCWSINDHVIFL